MTAFRRSLSALLLTASLVSAQPQSAAQQACIAAVTGNAAALARAQARRDVDCVLAAGAGDLDPACLAGDPSGRVAAALATLTSGTVADCGVAPDFGVPFRPTAIASAAALVHERGLITDLFQSAASMTQVASGTDTARCRRTVVRYGERLLATSVRTALACERAALRDGAADPATLAACIAAPSSGAVARATARLRGQIRRACGDADVDAALPGRCAAATDVAECVRSRVDCRACRLLNAAGALDADCELLDDGAANDSCRMLVSVSGDILPFHLVPNGRLGGATVSILEHPDRQVVTGDDGHFQFDDLEEGSEVTFVMSHPDYHPIQNSTIKLGPAGADRVTFQAVIYGIYQALGALLQLVPDDLNACQMVTTITRVGKSMYDPGAHGEDGALVQLHPPLPAEHGPIYFNSSVLPDRSLVESSDDGGVLFVQVPPGEYVWTATKPGAAFSRVKMKCRVGFLVNASPPWGLQAQ